MRPAFAAGFVLLMSACYQQPAPGTNEAVNPVQPDAPAPPEPAAEPGNEAADPAAAVAATPPDDPALAAMSPSRRREYERGWRDCATGNYAYDPDRQGESYRLGCMAAENAKAGEEP